MCGIKNKRSGIENKKRKVNKKTRIKANVGVKQWERKKWEENTEGNTRRKM